MPGKKLAFATLLVSLILVAALLSVSAAPPNASESRSSADASPSGEVVPGQVLLVRQEGASLASLDVDVIERVDTLGVDVVRVPVGQEHAEASRLSALPGVRYAEPNHIRYALATPNDEYYAGYQRNYPQIGLPAAWDITTGSADVVVAVIDSGVDLGHPELSGKLVAGYDFYADDSDPTDDDGHGTHVAGIVAAVTNNSTGVTGVGWNTSVMPIKVLGGPEGTGSDLMVAQGIRWAADQGAEIINMSLGGSSPATILADACTYAHDQGVLVIAAMGNSYEEGNPTEYPAAYDHVVAVGAVSDQDQHASYSCTGPHNDLMAPGGDPTSNSDQNFDHWIMSLYLRSKGQDYAWMSGTSQAAPHVAGVAALMLAVNPNLTPDEIEQALKDTAVDLGTAGKDNTFGYGRIDAAAAVSAVSEQATATPTTQPATATPTTQPPTATQTSQAPTATQTPAPPTATMTPTRSGPTAVLERSGFVPLVMKRSIVVTRPTLTPTPEATPRPTFTYTPTADAPRPTLTPTSEPGGMLPVAGNWEGDWIAFNVTPDRRHIRYLYYLADCAEFEITGANVPIAPDGSWVVPFGDQFLGGVVTGTFTSATTCIGQTESWDTSWPCHAIESWDAWPD